MLIFVCAIARAPATSDVWPPRKWRMLTPQLNPSRLTSMNCCAVPWNHVAHISASGCHTVANRSQSPESRHSAQFSTTSLIASFSLSISADDDAVAHRANPFDFGFHHIAVLQKLLRDAAEADAVGGACGDDVAGLEREAERQPLDDDRDRKDHRRCARVLLHRAVHPQRHLLALRIAEFIRRHDHRADRA